jgi:hypothetical protein
MVSGMFGWVKKPQKAKKARPSLRPPAGSSEAIRAQAMETARAARAAIGEDVLDRIAAAMTKKQRSATERARARIRDADADHVADELLTLLKDKSAGDS